MDGYSKFYFRSFGISFAAHIIILLILWSPFFGLPGLNSTPAAVNQALSIEFIERKEAPVAVQEQKNKSTGSTQQVKSKKESKKPSVSEQKSNASSTPSKEPSKRATVLKQQTAAYPKAAQNEEMEGTVILRVYIDARGQLTKYKLLQSSGYDLLDQTFIDTVKREYKFEAAQGDAGPLASTLVLEHTFSLE